jgi:hypothetical protein
MGQLLRSVPTNSTRAVRLRGVQDDCSPKVSSEHWLSEGVLVKASDGGLVRIGALRWQLANLYSSRSTPRPKTPCRAHCPHQHIDRPDTHAPGGCAAWLETIDTAVADMYGKVVRLRRDTVARGCARGWKKALQRPRRTETSSHEREDLAFQHCRQIE